MPRIDCASSPEMGVERNTPPALLCLSVHPFTVAIWGKGSENSQTAQFYRAIIIAHYSTTAI